MSEKRGVLLGDWIWIGTAAWLAIGLSIMLGCGCEDGGDRTTINQSPESVINVPTNGTTTVADLDVNGNQNTTIVYIQTAPGVSQVYSIDVAGNSNYLGFVATQPVPAVEETEEAAP
jgi:hypothetical protein